MTTTDDDGLGMLSDIHRKMIVAAAALPGGLDAKRVLLKDEHNRFASEPKELMFGRPAQAALGVEHYMRVTESAVRLGLEEGVDAVVREVAAAGSAEDVECLTYVLYADAGSSDITYQGGLKRDCDDRGRREATPAPRALCVA